VIGHKHSRPLLQRVLSANASVALDAAGDPKGSASDGPHAPLGRPRNCPLDQATIAYGPENAAYDDAVGRTAHHDEEGGDEEGVVVDELCEPLGEHKRERVHEDDECSWHGGEVEKPAHGGCMDVGLYYVVLQRQSRGAGDHAIAAPVFQQEGLVWRPVRVSRTTSRLSRCGMHR